jgi:acetyl-CoA synthetase (ADP-forming)
MFGLGGVLTEALKDITFRMAPVGKREALDMINTIKARDLLGPYRGMPGADIDRLAGMLMAIGSMGLEQPAINEIDVNPVMLSGRRPVAVDALIVLDADMPAGPENA